MKHDNEEREEEINLEPTEEVGDVGAAIEKLKRLKDELVKVKAEKQEYLDGWQRCKADAINSRKEALEMGERAGQRAKEALIEDIIPALDGFDMAAGSPAWESVDAGWRSGIDQIRNQLLDALSRHGVERYGKMGDIVDHAIHETVEESDGFPGEPGKIVRILRYGYKMNDRVLRPAQVIVKK